MAFDSYLMNLGIDAGLIIIGTILVLTGYNQIAMGERLIGAGILAIGMISLLYTRYRTLKGTTY